MNKLSNVMTLLEQNGVDAIILYSHDNRYWFSRFSSSLGYLLVTKNHGVTLFLDGRYITAAQKKQQAGELINVDTLVNFSSNPLIMIKTELEKLGLKKVGFEADWVYFAEYAAWEKTLSPIALTPINTEKLREKKDAWEIAQLKKACDISAQVFVDVLQYVKPGMTEKELARFVSDANIKNGAEKNSFDTIVASGVNGDMPHAVPTDKKIAVGDFVTLDMGAFYNGYCSDQTRTFVMGAPASDEIAKIYDIVKEAQGRGIAAVKPGVLSGEIHKICYDYIAEQGYGQYFTHGTGHGIGTQIHEEPYQNAVGKTPLEPGMCITVEPGIYVPGLGGVRIEDDILVTENGYEMLTTAPRDLQTVNC